MTLQELYFKNCELDQKYVEKYGMIPDYFAKNCIALLVELGEFTNETKCFKYWSVKKPKKDEMLEELADCLMLSMQFLHYYHFDCEVNMTGLTDSVLELLNELFQMTSCLMQEASVASVKGIYWRLWKLGKVFGFSQEEIIDACEKKIKKCYHRLEDENY